MEFIPSSFILGCAIVLGAVIGSFANVVICRLHTGKSLNTRSHCLSCGQILAWYDLVPLISYVALLGRCRTCGAWIPIRYVLVELATALLFALVVLFVHAPVLILLYFGLLTVLVIIAVYDLYHLIIPDELVVWLLGIAVVIVGYEVYSTGTWMHATSAIIGGVTAFIVYAGMWYVSSGRWIGFGDAKLAIPLGALVGAGSVFSLVVLSFWIGAGISVCLLILQRLWRGGQKYLPFMRARLKMKSEIPFAPFLIIAFLLVLLLKVNVLALTTYVLTL